jgi:hypothetical protein
MSELDGSGAVQVTYTNEPQQYGGVISQRRGTTTSTYHADALGSTRRSLTAPDLVTDTYLNDAWGNSVASTGTTVNPFKWSAGMATTPTAAPGRFMSAGCMANHCKMVQYRSSLFDEDISLFLRRSPITT